MLPGETEGKGRGRDREREKEKITISEPVLLGIEVLSSFSQSLSLTRASLAPLGRGLSL